MTSVEFDKLMKEAEEAGLSEEAMRYFLKVYGIGIKDGIEIQKLMQEKFK